MAAKRYVRKPGPPNPFAIITACFEGRCEVVATSEPASASVAIDAAVKSRPRLDHVEEAEVIIAKHRSGPVGKVSLGFQASCARYRSLYKEGRR